jgi:hypothetical protein
MGKPIHGKYYSTSEYHRAWFTGELFKEKQSFGTFARFHPEILIDQIRDLVKDPSKSTVLEIGPGNAPVSAALPFKRRIFIDRSAKIATDLKTPAALIEVTAKNLDAFKGHSSFEKIKERVNKGEPTYAGIRLDSKNTQIVVGDATALPFRKDVMHDLVVVNEVLTHVKPEERVKTLESIAALTGAILIVDRNRLPLERISHHPRFTEANRLEMERQVDFNELRKALPTNEWHVQTIEVTSEKQAYTILKAVRRK